ncbi:MAG: hypothetical protein V2L15_03780 [Desulfobacteraceae bacterium]|jgi:hypothetical protein|nr:hypothetical protein [Desulfobacteraceae bacterium]
MKKSNLIGLAMLVMAMVAAPAQAASEDIVNLGAVQMPRGDLERLKALVAGEPAPEVPAPVAGSRVNLGVVELAQSELDRIQALMAGAELASAMVAAGEELVNLGRIGLPRSDFEALKLKTYASMMQK